MYDYMRRNPAAVNQALQASGSSYQIPQYQGRTAGDARQQGDGGVDIGSAIGIVDSLSNGSGNSGTAQQGGGMGIQTNPYEDRTAADAREKEEGGLLSSGVIGKVLGLLL